MRVCWNRQTGTFEGRVSLTYGFKSHLPHQIRENDDGCSPLFFYIFYRRKRLWKNLFPLKNFPKRNSANLTQSEEKIGTESTPLQENPKTRKHITEKGHKTEMISILCPFVLFAYLNGNSVDFNAFVRGDHDIFSSVHDLGFNKIGKFRSDGNFYLWGHHFELFAFDDVLGF